MANKKSKKNNEAPASGGAIPSFFSFGYPSGSKKAA